MELQQVNGAGVASMDQIYSDAGDAAFDFRSTFFHVYFMFALPWRQSTVEKSRLKAALSPDRW